MVYDLLAWLSGFIVNFISNTGYTGVTVLMALESAGFPIPSEIIMPFSGYLVFLERFSFWPVVIWGTIGNLLGSIAAYFVGLYGGRPLLEKWGKYALISGRDLAGAQKWFEKYGQLTIFFSRVLPVIRTYISFPAGIARMPFWKFSFYTFLGSLPWAFALTYLGLRAGENWSKIEVYFRKLDWVFLALAVLLIIWWVYHKLKTNKNED